MQIERFRRLTTAVLGGLALCTMAASCPSGNKYGVVGIQSDLQPTIYSQARAAGIGWVKIFFDWSKIAPNASYANCVGLQSQVTATQPLCRWDADLANYGTATVDEAVDRAAAAGFSILVVLTSHTNVPSWVNLSNLDAAYASYATAVAQRYKDKVHAYDPMGEPNWNDNGFFNGGTMCRYYGKIFVPTYNAIKLVQPGAILVGPSTHWGNPAGTPAPIGGDPGPFLVPCAGTSMTVKPDAITAQIYHPDLSVLDDRLATMTGYADELNISTIWVTEFGFSVQSDCSATASPPNETGVGNAITGYLERLNSGVFPKLKRMFIFKLADPGPIDRSCQPGLLKQDQSEKLRFTNFVKPYLASHP